MLEYFYLDTVVGRATKITKQSIPVLLSRKGKGKTVIAIKNNSKEYIGSISLAISGIVPSSQNLSWAMTSTLKDPEVYETTQSITYSEVLPFSIAYLYFSVNSNADYLASIASFNLTVSYLKSKFSLLNTISYFDFNGANKSTTVNSIYPSLSAVVSSSVSTEPIIRGSGYAYSRNPNDSITFTCPSALTSISVFVNTSIFEMNVTPGLPASTRFDFPILSSSTFEFGINKYRKVYVKIGTAYVDTLYELPSKTKEYDIKVSITDTDNMIFTVDNSIIDIDTSTLPVTVASLSIPISDTMTIGNNGSDQFIGNIKDIAIFSNHRTINEHMLGN